MASTLDVRQDALRLKQPTLFRQRCYLNGAWVDADNHATIAVMDPASGERIGTVPKMGAAEARRAIEAANAALPTWRAKTAKERAAVLRRWFELILANQDDLALLMTTEQGKPLAEARAEVVYGASFIEWFAEEAKRVYGEVIPLFLRRREAEESPVAPAKAGAHGSDLDSRLRGNDAEGGDLEVSGSSAGGR